METDAVGLQKRFQNVRNKLDDVNDRKEDIERQTRLLDEEDEFRRSQLELEAEEEGNRRLEEELKCMEEERLEEGGGGGWGRRRWHSPERVDQPVEAQIQLEFEAQRLQLQLEQEQLIAEERALIEDLERIRNQIREPNGSGVNQPQVQ